MKPLDQLRLIADPEGCRVVSLPQRVWLLGGPCASSSNPPESLRDWFLRKSLNLTTAPTWLAHVERLEDYPGWLEFSGYSDLLEFERDACYLARAVILFAESPGAFAELGALAIDPALRERLAVVVDHRHQTYDKRTSFLHLGPIRRIAENAHIVIGPVVAGELAEPDVQSIVESVSDWLPEIPSTTKFRPSDPAHRLLLIADLVDLFLVSKLEEIGDGLAHFGVQISEAELKKALSLLAFLELVLHEKHGGAPFWLRRDASNVMTQHFLLRSGR